MTARAGKTSTRIVAKAKAANGQLDTRMTAASLRGKLKAAVGSEATITAVCSVKAGKKLRKLPPATVTVKFV